jgi:polar amino acid transport system substrate-binding protein
MTEVGLKRGLSMLAPVVLGAAIAAPAYAQPAGSSVASAQGESHEIRAAAMVVPPIVMEQNGALTGFSVDLWNAIAARLKLRTSYQMMPDEGAVEEAMRSKRADLTLSVFITSARDEIFDFSIPTLQAGLQVMVWDTGETPQTGGPLWDLLRLLFSRTTAVWLGVAIELTGPLL